MTTKEGDPLGRLPDLSQPTLEGLRIGAYPEIEGYEILGPLGEAGQGRVWRAVQLSTRRQVALKVPRVDLLRSQKALARFEREIELAARLNHPNIAQIHDSGIYQGSYYYAMELIDGTSLDDYVERHRLSHRQVLELMRTVCGAVLHAHQNGVIHRDIKPSNVLVTADGQPHLVDFGLAMDVVGDDAQATLSTEGEVTGTPAYMSPEQAAGRHEQLDTRTDVYSLGVVLYRLLTGGFPYDVKTSMVRTLRNIQEADPIRPSRTIRHLDRACEAILLKALAKEPADRYQSVAELQADMGRWLAGMPVLAGSDGSLYLLRKLIARHRYTSTVVGLLGVIVAGFMVVSVQLLTELRRTNAELGRQKERLVRQIEGSVRYAQSAVFAEFLKGWHNGQTGQAKVFTRVFGDGTREDEAVRFLEDKRPLTEKIEGFRGRIEKAEPGFVEFVLAEHHLRDGNKAEAVNAYRACLGHEDLARQNPWLAVWVKGRLYELTGDGAGGGP